MASNGYVKTSIFRLAVIVLASAISGLFGLYIAQNNAVADLRVEISAIRTDINWIKNIADEGNRTSLRSFDGNEATLNLAVGKESLAKKINLTKKIDLLY